MRRVREMFGILQIGSTLEPSVNRDTFQCTILGTYRNKPIKGGKVKSNSTMANYLGYLHSVLRYITKEQLYDKVGVSANECISMKCRIEDERKLFKKGASKDRTLREEREIDSIRRNLSNKNITSYFNTPSAQNA